MKLNKNGWGLGTFIAFIVIFIICLIISAVGLRQIGLLDEDWQFINIKDFNSGIRTAFNYTDLETKATMAARDYIEKEYNNTLGYDTLSVKIKTMIETGYLTEFKDGKDRDCTGYVSVYKTDAGDKVFTPYIKCKRYTSSGYEERKDS